MRTIVIITVMVVVALAGAPWSAKAHCSWRHPGHCAKKVLPSAVVEVVEDAEERVKKIIPKELKQVGQATVDVAALPARAAAELAGEAAEVVGDVAGGALSAVGDVAEEVPGLESVGDALDDLGDNVENLGDAIEAETDRAEAKKHFRDTGRKLDDVILQELKRAVEGAGRKFDDEVLQSLKYVLTRCYERAEREPVPERRQARWKRCAEKDTGSMLGYVGLAAGSAFGPGGIALGSLAGSLVGSAIDGAPNISIFVQLDLPGPGPAADREPNREPAGEVEGGIRIAKADLSTASVATLRRIKEKQEAATAMQATFAIYATIAPLLGGSSGIIAAPSSIETAAQGVSRVTKIAACAIKKETAWRKLDAATRNAPWKTDAERRYFDALHAESVRVCYLPSL